jgi:hypothetical protein
MLVHRDTHSSYSYYTAPSKKIIIDALVLLVPTLTFLEFRLIGRLFLSEIMLIGFIPFLLFSKGWMLRDPLPKKLFTLGVLWLFAQVITDLIRGTPFQDYSRGWAKITFFMLNFAALYMLLYNNRRRLILFALGLVFSGFLAYKFKIDSPFSYARSYPWKFGIGSPITFLMVLLTTISFVYRVRFLPSLILASLAILNLYLGFRSLAGICFLAGVYTFIQQRFVGNVNVRVKPSLKKIALISFLFFGAAIFFIKSYEYAAENYWLGEKARDHYRFQSAGDFGIILGGRGALYSAVRAITDSPLIGHGSWAKNTYYVDVLLDLQKYGYKIRSLDSLYRSGLIPTHSHLLGGWVEAGILGAVLWGWVLLLIAKVLLHQYNIKNPLTTLIAYIGISLVWDVMLSPFGAERRLITAFFLVLLMSALAIFKPHEHYAVADNASNPSR